MLTVENDYSRYVPRNSSVISRRTPTNSRKLEVVLLPHKPRSRRWVRGQDDLGRIRDVVC